MLVIVPAMNELLMMCFEEQAEITYTALITCGSWQPRHRILPTYLQKVEQWTLI